MNGISTPSCLDVTRKSVQIVITTKEFVDWALSINSHNRPPRRNVVLAYADQMRRGLWELTSQGIGFCAAGYLCDGQHRLMANREAGYPPVEMLVVTGLTNMAQAKVDAHSKRTLSNAIGLAKDIWLHNDTCAVTRFLGRIDGRGDRLAVEDIVDVYEQYQAAFDAIRPYPSDAPRAAGFITAVVYGLHHGIPEDRSRAYFRGIADGVGLGRGDPRLAMRNYLADKKHYRRGGGGVQQDVLFCATARTLTAWAKGEAITKLYTPETITDAAAMLRDAGTFRLVQEAAR